MFYLSTLAPYQGRWRLCCLHYPTSFSLWQRRRQLLPLWGGPGRLPAAAAAGGGGVEGAGGGGWWWRGQGYLPCWSVTLMAFLVLRVSHTQLSMTDLKSKLNSGHFAPVFSKWFSGGGQWRWWWRRREGSSLIPMGKDLSLRHTFPMRPQGRPDGGIFPSPQACRWISEVLGPRDLKRHLAVWADQLSAASHKTVPATHSKGGQCPREHWHLSGGLPTSLRASGVAPEPALHAAREAGT